MTDTLPALCDEIERLEREATPGPWESWRRGNSRLADGSGVGVSHVRGPEKPYHPESYWFATAEAQRAVLMTDADADLIVALRNAAPALLSAARELAEIKGAGDTARAELARGALGAAKLAAREIVENEKLRAALNRITHLTAEYDGEDETIDQIERIAQEALG